MDIKNTAILLILLLSIIGLLAGVSLSNDSDNNYSHTTKFEKIHEDKDGVETITLEKKEKDNLNKYLT